jgi:ribA/ribD-fused uncharacterized protein
MSKQFSAKKISFKVIIERPIIPPLNEYYRLKNLYEDALQNKKIQKKCVKCKQAYMNTLQFINKNRQLIGICPTANCPVNMIIPIETCKMYNEYYNAKKQLYEDISNDILSEKFNILFGYKKEQSSNILELKKLYIDSFSNIQNCIDTYKQIVYPNQDKLTELEEKRDVLIEEIKTMEFIPPTVFDQLKQILCQIRILKYKKIDIPNTNITTVKMPYTFPDLEICESEGSVIETTEPIKESPKNKIQKTTNVKEINTNEKKEDYVQFYSGSKDKNIQLLSNLSALNVIYNSKEYPSVEHAYQLMKYEYSEPKDKSLAVMEKLYEETKTLSGKEAVTIGKRKRMEKEGVKLNIEEWNKASNSIMEALIMDKIKRHPEIRKILDDIHKSGKKLLHYSLRDMEWGGFFTKDKITGEEGLKGNNELGKIYMKLLV